MPAGHPLAQVERIDAGRPGAAAAGLLPPFVQRPRASTRPSRARKLKPNIVLEAIDADVIKTYVRLGAGRGHRRRTGGADDAAGGELVSRPLGHLFGRNVTRIAFKRGAYLRNFVYAFAEMLRASVAPLIAHPARWPAAASAADDYQL